MLEYVGIYLSIAIIFIISLVVGILKYKIKNEKGFLRYFGIASFAFIIVFVLVFIFEKPKIDLKSIENIEVKSQVEMKTPKTFYHFKDITEQVKITENIDFNRLGEYDVNFETKVLFGTYTKKYKVKIVDTTPPELILNGKEDYKQSYATEYKEPGYKAIDQYEGDLSDKVNVLAEQINELEYNIRYSVQDLSGNSVEKIRHVTIVDDISPIITLNGKANIYLSLNEKYEETGAKAVDEKEGDLTDKISIEGNVDISKEGIYTITYKVSDSKGNEAIKSRVITVSNDAKIMAQNGSNGTKGVIYLTFDDGPSSTITPKILDILKEKNVKATFFILNYNEDGEKLVKREYAEGHTVAIHGYSHQYSEIYQSVDTYMNNITRLQEKIRNSIGYNATITRFPGGSSNTISRKYSVGIMTTLCHVLLERGYTYFDWNVDSDDAGSAKTSDDVYNNVTKRLSLNRQNVILMHDFSGNTKTLNALSKIIDYGLQNGYTFSKITEDTPMVTHTPNN